jgi:hypothetical protein
MRAVAADATKAVAPHISAGLKWGAVLSGLGLLLLLYLAVAKVAPKGQRTPWKLVEGADGAPSTSKFQWFLWLVVVLFAYTALWVLRAEQGNFSALNQIPVNILTVLGFSTGTAAAAKGITSAYVQSGRVAKQDPSQGPAQGGIFQDDSNMPELAKIQMIGFTFIAIGIFLITVIHQIVTNQATAGLPNIDATLMVLMGISTGGYLGKKLVTANSPTLYAPDPPRAATRAPVTLPGANLGSSAGQLTLNGSPIETTSWSASSVGFNVPETDPASNAGWTGTTTVQLAVSVMGQESNSVPFTITGPSAAPAGADHQAAATLVG